MSGVGSAGAVTRTSVVLRGREVPVTIHGPTDAIPVLLMPGGAVGCTDCFPEIIESVPGARFVVHDRPGSGTTPAPDAGVSLRSWTEDTVSLLDQLEIERVVLVGHSLGGALAAQILADHPDRVAAALLLEPGPLNDPQLCAQAATGFRVMHRITGLPLVGGALKSLLVRAGRPRGLTAAARRSYDATFVGDWIGDTARSVVLLREEAEQFLARHLSPVNAPVIVVTADRKPEHGLRRACEGLASSFGGSCEVWPGTGHSVHLQRPERVADRLRTLVAHVAT
jgi:pimeloyl-ACP methyl ester carboxylesterase